MHAKASTILPATPPAPRTVRVEHYRAASVRGGPWIDVEAECWEDAESEAIRRLRCVPGDLILRYCVTRFVRQ